MLKTNNPLNMKKLTILFVFVCLFASSFAQTVKEMRWTYDYKIHVKFSNDTSQVVDVKALQHSGSLTDAISDKEATYYTVSLDADFVKALKDKKLLVDKVEGDTLQKVSNQTLWSALHTSLGGSYIHFINCMMYALESDHLNLTDPIMKRPVTSWKPKPMTESFKRTHKWSYYIPFTQKVARKEFKTQQKKKEDRDIMLLPIDFRTLFLATNDKNYAKLKSAGDKKSIAKIDLIRLLLGAKYLGEDQIKYIKAKVITAIYQYSANSLPSVIIFDDLNAAVAMTLNSDGYKVEQIVFRDADSIDQEEIDGRKARIEAFLRAINEANDRVFKKRLSSYYGN